MKIFFDGGLQPMPDGMEWAIVAAGRTRIARALGPGTSMTAEWLALIAAMRLADELHLRDVVLLGDAAAVIAQANGRARVPLVHRDHARLYAALPRPGGRIRLRHVRRGQNLAGIALAALHRGRMPGWTHEPAGHRPTPENSSCRRQHSTT